jgi:S1-C subfamily serine protease
VEHLSKQQIILLALLCSFVTSLATGIVTVSLMDQAPQNIARTITQVVQQTVAGVPTGATSTAAVAIAVSDQVADATDRVIPSLVRLRDGDFGAVTGLGLIVAKTGTVMADKNVMDRLNIPQAVFGNNTSVPVTIIRFQMGGDIAFLAPQRSVAIELKPIALGNIPHLGASIWSLTGTSTYALSQGIVTSVETDPSGAADMIRTSIPTTDLLPGAPLFNANGEVVGIATYSVIHEDHASFYPMSLVRDGIPK